MPKRLSRAGIRRVGRPLKWPSAPRSCFGGVDAGTRRAEFAADAKAIYVRDRTVLGDETTGDLFEAMMVQSKAGSVDEFMSGLPPERVTALERLRQECLVRFLGWEERMQWGMPGYGPLGEDARICFNSQKNYISVYPGMDAIEANKGALRGATFGKGCVRFADPDRIDFAVVGAMLDQAYRSKGGQG